MGMLLHGKSLLRALFTRTQRRLLGLLFGHPERSFYANELVRLAGIGTGTVQRELARLAATGIVRVQRLGNQKHYQANPDCPIYPELRALVVKTLGGVDPLRSAVHGLAATIELALLHGVDSAALASPGTPLDLLVVSPDLHRDRAQPVLDGAGQLIGRRIRWLLLRPERFQALWRDDDPRLRDILAGPHTVLVGQLPAKT